MKAGAEQSLSRTWAKSTQTVATCLGLGWVGAESKSSGMVGRATPTTDPCPVVKVGPDFARWTPRLHALHSPTAILAAIIAVRGFSAPGTELTPELLLASPDSTPAGIPSATRSALKEERTRSVSALFIFFVVGISVSRQAVGKVAAEAGPSNVSSSSSVENTKPSSALPSVSRKLTRDTGILPSLSKGSSILWAWRQWARVDSTQV
mmetsp:Transcript_5415/g.12586  ORF Transcript_5415/g.12586 Transcript_5415/m.12586 type:complete len:207 (-) Transcript_5415:211-831(-)